MRNFFAFILLSMLCLGVYSCSSNGCEETRETFCYADLSKKGTSTLNQLQIWYNDTLVSSIETSPTSFELVLPPDSSHIAYRIDMVVTEEEEMRQVTDTLDIQYEAFPFFLNMECGCSVYFTLKEVSLTHNFLQNVTLINNDITNEESVNLRIEY